MSTPIESALNRIKPQVRALEPYTLRPYDPMVKLNQNENPYDVPADLKKRIMDRLAGRPWNRYPAFVARDLISAVSEAVEWPQGGILVGNGSNELIQAILATVVQPGVAVVIPEPTFTLYRLLTGVNGGDVVGVPLTGSLAFDVEAIIAASRENDAALVVLCSPNNPTGSALTRDEIVRIHDETDAIVVLDQAYIEFGGYDAVPLLTDRPRLVVLRTYSKAMSMAGLRTGYLLAEPRLADEFAKAKLPYNLNFFTEAAAAEVLRNRHLLMPRIEELRESRDRMYDELSALPGIRVYPSEANFLLIRIEDPELDHKRIFGRLLDEFDVLVRDVSGYPMLERCLRVNAGSKAENEQFLAGMKTILESSGSPPRSATPVPKP